MIAFMHFAGIVYQLDHVDLFVGAVFAVTSVFVQFGFVAHCLFSFFAFIQVPFQNIGSGNTVDRALAVFSAHAAFDEHALRLHGGEALVLFDDGDIRLSAQQLDEAAGLVRLHRFAAVEVIGHAADDEPRPLFEGDGGEGGGVRLGVFAAAVGGAGQGEGIERVAGGNADPFIAYIEGNDTLFHTKLTNLFRSGPAALF